MNDLELMRLDIETSFTFDARGRMLQTNEPGRVARRPAPRLFVGRTALGNLVHLRADVPDKLSEPQPDFRGRGYASLATAAWASAVRASGREPLYSTDWQNAASQAVARHLGLTSCGEHLSWT